MSGRVAETIVIRTTPIVLLDCRADQIEAMKWSGLAEAQARAACGR